MVDIGSNSVRLLLSPGCDASGPTGERETHVIGLKRGARSDGTLADVALQRLDRHLGEVAERIAAAGDFETVAVGTSAVRDAPNRERVAELVRRRLGFELIVLSGRREAELAYRGARLAVPGDAPVAVVDIGGASTEIAVGSGGTPQAVSLDLGVVRNTTGALAEDPPDAAALRRLRRDAAAAFARATAGFPAHERAIGVAGTFTSLAAIALGRYAPEIVHGYVLSAARAEALMDDLADLTLTERRDVPGLHPDRAPVIVTGAALALAALDALGDAEITISERDLLDGVALTAAEDRLRGDRPIS